MDKTIAVAPDGKRAAVVSAGSYIIEFIDLDTITSEDASGTCRINKQGSSRHSRCPR
ncbi:hypothetical protein WME97_48420 [Sorangium sp. So ce367]|uniref:hypothetical protein n=1 Tax=Sorangium sp. So ce367 TaxID=3133305 RepID=UPI003F61EAAA